MITTFYPPYTVGGDGIFVQGLAHELAGRGHHVEVIHCTDAYRAVAAAKPAATGRSHPEVIVHRLSSPGGILSPLLTHQVGAPLLKSAQIRRILSRDFDVIHFHNISLVGGPKILQYGDALKLYTMHEYWLLCPTHTLFKFNREACRAKQCALCSLVYRRPPQLWRHTGLLASAVRHVDAFIALSRFAKEKHDEMFPGLPIVQLPPFVPQASETDDAHDAHFADPAPGGFFLFAGRLERLKGLHTLLSVFRRFSGAPLLVAGTGSCERRLRHLARGSNVMFLGHCTQARLRSLLRKALALIVPSVCYEIQPLVILEAFREGTPVVARRIGGLPELLDESRGGCTFETDDQLLDLLNRLAGEAALRRGLSENALRSYSQNWTGEAHITRYLRLIEQVSIAKETGSR